MDALLIDDIQFFAKKEQSQEELFHTFNSLLEKGSQMILTCDKYPKEIDGLEDRLKSRLGWGLPVVIEPPELETRVAILLSKALLKSIATLVSNSGGSITTGNPQPSLDFNLSSSPSISLGYLSQVRII